MQTGLRISFEYLKAFRLPLSTTHCVFIIFCDFQNYTANDQNAISAYFASRFYWKLECILQIDCPRQLQNFKEIQKVSFEIQVYLIITLSLESIEKDCVISETVL